MRRRGRALPRRRRVERRRGKRSRAEATGTRSRIRSSDVVRTVGAGWTLSGLVSFRDPPRWDAARCVSRARARRSRGGGDARVGGDDARDVSPRAFRARACASRGRSRPRTIPAFDRVDALAEASPEDTRRFVASGASVGGRSARWARARRTRRRWRRRKSPSPPTAPRTRFARTRTSRSASRDSLSSRTPSSPVASSSRRAAETTSRTASRRARTSSRFTAPPPRSPPSAGSPGSTDDRRRIVRPWRRRWRWRVLTDAVAVACAHDAVAPSRRPERWRLPSLVVAASVCGVVGAATSLPF